MSVTSTTSSASTNDCPSPAPNGAGGGGAATPGAAATPGSGGGKEKKKKKGNRPGRISLPTERRGQDMFDTNGNIKLGDAISFTGPVRLQINQEKLAVNANDLIVLDQVGRGNYGSVFRVKHGPTSREMAMKQISLDSNVLEQSRKQIIMELDILKRSECPFIVDFYGSCTSVGIGRVLEEAVGEGGGGWV